MRNLMTKLWDIYKESSSMKNLYRATELKQLKQTKETDDVTTKIQYNKIIMAAIVFTQNITYTLTMTNAEAKHTHTLLCQTTLLSLMITYVYIKIEQKCHERCQDKPISGCTLFLQVII